MAEINQPSDVQRVEEKRGLFSYAPNLPISIRIVAFLLLLGGIGMIVVAAMDFFITEDTTEETFYMPPLFLVVLGIFYLVLSNGLARLKKWAFYLYAAVVLIGFLINPFGSIIALILFAFVFVNRKRFN